MPSKKPQKRDKIIALLRKGETSPVIIANKVKCNVVYVYRVKDKLLQELLRSQKT